MKYRHEYKYISPEILLKVIEARARSVMQIDEHSRGSGYAIRSVYFDDMYDTCLKENEDGVDPRYKWRIRIYNLDSAHITLEMKIKEKGKTLKKSCPIDKELCMNILKNGAGNGPSSREARSASKQFSAPSVLLEQFMAEAEYRALRPVCVVCYERTPYICTAGNVRVTFDRNIRSSSDAARLFERGIACRPVLPCGVNMMEVKYDEFIPDYLAEILQTGALTYSSFSKYALCRRYGFMQGVI